MCLYVCVYVHIILYTAYKQQENAALKLQRPRLGGGVFPLPLPWPTRSQSAPSPLALYE